METGRRILWVSHDMGVSRVTEKPTLLYHTIPRASASLYLFIFSSEKSWGEVCPYPCPFVCSYTKRSQITVSDTFSFFKNKIK